MKQISILVKDKQGLLAEISELMANHNINITDIEALSFGDSGLIVMNVDAYDHALSLLRDAGLAAISEESLLVKLEDKPGALARLARRFSDAHINIRGLHIVHRDNHHSLVAISTERSEQALALVKEILVA